MRKLDIQGAIGWRTTSDDLKNAMSGVKPEEDLTIFLNSFGGYVNNGLDMHDMLHSHKGKKTFKIKDAASIATVIASAARNPGDKVIMSTNGIYMIHNVSGGVEGEAADLRKHANLMEMSQTKIANILAAKSGLSLENVLALMKEETWLTAEQAQGLGFIDEVVESIEFNFESKEEEDVFWNSAEVPGVKKPKRITREDMPAVMSNEKFQGFLNAFGANKADKKEAKKEEKPAEETPEANENEKVFNHFEGNANILEGQKKLSDTIMAGLQNLTDIAEGKDSEKVTNLTASLEAAENKVKDLDAELAKLTIQNTELANQLSKTGEAKAKLENQLTLVANLKTKEGQPHTINSLLAEHNQLILDNAKTPALPNFKQPKKPSSGGWKPKTFKELGK